MRNDNLILCFFDLDETLLKSNEIRKKSIGEALKISGIAKNDKELKKLMNIYENKIYKNWRIFKALGFKNFRQYWNDLYVYYIIITLSDYTLWSSNTTYYKFCAELEMLQKYLDFIWNSKSTYYRKWRGSYKKIVNFTRKNETQEFLYIISKLRSNKMSGKKIKNAASVYNNTIKRYMKPSPYLAEILEGLQRKNIETFLVTEGVRNAQFGKLKTLQLEKYFSNEKIFITENLFSAEAKIAQLKKEILHLENKKIKTRNPALTQLSVTDRKKLLIYFLEILYELSTKSETFYAYVIHTILNNIQKRRIGRMTVPLVSPMEWPENLHILIVGDMYDKDILPIIKLTRNSALTIRILSGKYKNDYSPEYLENEGMIKPKYTVKIFPELRDLLSTLEIFKRSKPIKWFPIFTIRRGKTNLDWLNSGMKERKFSFIRKLTNSIQQELNFVSRQ